MQNPNKNAKFILARGIGIQDAPLTFNMLHLNICRSISNLLSFGRCISFVEKQPPHFSASKKQASHVDLEDIASIVGGLGSSTFGTFSNGCVGTEGWHDTLPETNKKEHFIFYLIFSSPVSLREGRSFCFIFKLKLLHFFWWQAEVRCHITVGHVS